MRAGQLLTTIILLTVAGVLLVGCGEPQDVEDVNLLNFDVGTTIGSLVDVFSLASIPVEGYAIVGGLNGKGSSQCPPAIRGYLEKYARQQLTKGYNIEDFIDSEDTAVVRVWAMMPTATANGEGFDLRVEALEDTGTASLEDGWLWGGELFRAGRFGIALRPLATAQGPVYIDRVDSKEPDLKRGYILGGGRSSHDYKISLGLREPGLRMSAAIRNRINERFGPNAARAVSPELIQLSVPDKYKNQPERFIALVKATFLRANSEMNQERISRYVKELAVRPSEQKAQSEIALEAIGRASASKLLALLNSSNEEVKLRAARCMLNLGSEKGLGVLRTIANDPGSTFRIEAIEAVTSGAKNDEAAGLARQLLREETGDIQFAAYQSLKKLDDVSIFRETLSDTIDLELIGQSSERRIFVTRSGKPAIAILGSPIRVRSGTFVESPRGIVTLNAPAGGNRVSIIRKNPSRPWAKPIHVETSNQLSDIIRMLCEDARIEPRTGRQPGLSVSYAEVAGLLKRLADNNAVDAEFEATALPEIR